MKKILIFIIILLEIFLFIYSKDIIIEFRETINICLFNLLPSMFFSIFFSNFIYLNNSFIKDEILIFLLSILGGYPNNIKLIDNKNEYLNYVTNYINPLFFFGTVYNLYLNNLKLIIIIYISHFLSNIVLLFIFKNKYTINILKKDIPLTSTYYLSLKNTISTLSIIFSNLFFLTILTTLLKKVLSFNTLINSFIIGILEFSKGIYEVSKLDINIYLKGLIILIFITFGSFSIHFQMISLNEKIKYIKFLVIRIFNVFISIIIYLLIISLIN